MPLTFTNARLVDAAGEAAGALRVEGGRIVALGPNLPSDPHALDLAGALVTPGFVDVHTHGGGGFSLHTTDPDELRAYAAWAASTGTTAFLAGIVGVPNALPEAQISAAVSASRAAGPGPELLGIHLEGPYISYARRGAHSPSWLRTPNPVETERLLELADGRLRIVTLAPELPGAHALIQRLDAAGVTVSIGHTDCTYEQARAAIPLGLRHATHCFNAMRPLHHREPGPLGAIVEAEGVLGELIADGFHVHPAAMRVLIRALGPERTVIVTDALACAGLRDAAFSFGGQQARVVDGVAKLADGTLTGSVLTMDRALALLTRELGLALPAAVGCSPVTRPAPPALASARAPWPPATTPTC